MCCLFLIVFFQFLLNLLGNQRLCEVCVWFTSISPLPCSLIGLLSHLTHPVHSLPILLPSLLQKRTKMGKDFFEVISAPTRLYLLSRYQKQIQTHTHTHTHTHPHHCSPSADIAKHVNHNSEGFGLYLSSLKLCLIYLIDDTSRVVANKPDI